MQIHWVLLHRTQEQKFLCFYFQISSNHRSVQNTPDFLGGLFCWDKVAALSMPSAFPQAPECALPFKSNLQRFYLSKLIKIQCKTYPLTCTLALGARKCSCLKEQSPTSQIPISINKLKFLSSCLNWRAAFMSKSWNLTYSNLPICTA